MPIDANSTPPLRDARFLSPGSSPCVTPLEASGQATVEVQCRAAGGKMWGGAEGGESTSFRFNFGGGEAGDDSDDGATTTTAAAAAADEVVVTADAAAGSVIPGSEYIPSPDAAAPDWDMEEVIIRGRRFIKGASRGTAALLVRDASSTDNEDEERGKLASSDVVKGKYEGGFKLWECSVDLAAYLLEHDPLQWADGVVRAEDDAAPAAVVATTKTDGTAAGSRASCGDDRDDAAAAAAAGGARIRRRKREGGGGGGGGGEDDVDGDGDGKDNAGREAWTRSAPLAGANVIELGCGHGLPGIAAAYCGAAAVTFADYNPEVLETLTAPNVLANTPDIVAAAAAAATETRTTTKRNRKGVCGAEAATRAPSFRYLGGDWSRLHDFIAPQSADLVLAAETIYSPAAYPKHVAILRHCMKPPRGIALVAAKSYYFGVGGGTRLFAAAMEKDGTFAVDVVASYVDGASNVREILRVRFK